MRIQTLDLPDRLTSLTRQRFGKKGMQFEPNRKYRSDFRGGNDRLPGHSHQQFGQQRNGSQARGKYRCNKSGRKEKLYRWSRWGAQQLAARFTGGAFDDRLDRAGLRVATTALRQCGAFYRGSDASPLQPRFCDVVDLVLTFNHEMRGAVVTTLRRQAELLADWCHGQDIVPILWDGGHASLNHPLYAFRILVSGAAKMVRDGRADELATILAKRDPFPLLWEAIGSCLPQFLNALQNGQTGSFGSARIMRVA